MEDKILVNLSTDANHTFECPTNIIGREGEGNTTRFEITIPAGLTGCSVYLDFEKPDGEKIRTPKLAVENGVAVYDVVEYLLAVDGEIKVQAVLITENGQTWKSSIKRYHIHNSINALEEIPEKDDIITAFQKDLENISKALENTPYATPQMFGAKGDGTTDDTKAFQTALAGNRTVYVPSGTYKLTEGLVIGDNCALELAQDAVLNFTQTAGNCITLGMSSTLKGNHATIKVPYAFSGNVIYAYSNDTTEAEQNAVPPWTKWCPQWKSGRYVTDINICKVNASGNHESVGGECSGTAVYLSANGNSGSLKYMWGIHYSGLRIAGAFSYGIRAVNLNEGWMHEMRVDAFIDACEVGVQLEDCNNAYISAVIQPRATWHEDESKRIKYAKHGIKLIRSTNADLSGSRVWDWDEKRSLWAEGNEYQHIAMYGDCSGAIINDFRYHGSGDTRNRIYTDYANNLKTLTILQEPIDRWFKSKDNEPYFYDGVSDVQLAKQAEIDAHFITDQVKGFTDVLATSTDANGEIYNGKGYKNGVFLDGNGNEVAQPNGEKYHTATGFIPIEAGDVLYFRDIHFDSAISSGDGFAKLAYYRADKTKALTQTCTAMNDATKFYYQKYERTADGMKITFYDGVQEFGNDVSVRLSFSNYDFGENAVIAKNEEIKYTVEGFIADGVKIKGDNVLLTSASGKPFKLVVSENGALSTEEL